MKNKTTSIEKYIANLKSLDKEDLYFIDVKLKCLHCNKDFGIEREYIGIVTCPYCGKYTEG